MLCCILRSVISSRVPSTSGNDRPRGVCGLHRMYRVCVRLLKTIEAAKDDITYFDCMILYTKPFEVFG